MEQLPMGELMTVEQWIAKLRSKVNEIVVGVNEQLTTNETFNKTVEELNIKLQQHWNQQKEIIDSLDALRNSPFGDSFREWFKSRLTTTSDTIDDFTKAKIDAELERVKKLQQNEYNIRELILDAVTQRVVDLYKMSQKYTVTKKA